MLDDGLSSDPLSLIIMDASNERILWRSRRGAKEGNFKVDLNENQKASFCLQNGLLTTGRGKKKQPTNKPHPDGLERTVGFQFVVEPRSVVTEVFSQNSKLVKAATGLNRELMSLMSHHEYMRSREGTHRELVERIFSQLLVWAILESLAVIAVAAGQIIYFRRFLETRRYM
jgi:hypothetical protein